MSPSTRLYLFVIVSVRNYSGRESGEVGVCSVKKGGGGGKAAKSSARRSSNGSKQPSITDMFGRG